MGTMNKVILEFEEPFWDPECDSLSVQSEEYGKYPWFLNVVPYTQRNVLVCFITDHFARKISSLTDE